MVIVFFFQAEDGIRDRTVTGVQTCALPISQTSTMAPEQLLRSRSRTARSSRLPIARLAVSGRLTRTTLRHGLARSEERRVGKERRCRVWWDDLKKQSRC